MNQIPVVHKEIPPQLPFNSCAIIRTLTLIAAISGLLVVLVVEWTRPQIAANQRQAVEAAIFAVIPGAVQWRPFTLNAEGEVRQNASAGGTHIYTGYDEHGAIVGFAAEAASQGYADIIRLLYGYRPDCHCISGIKILKSAETPGLGDKIFTDSDFIANFTALDTRLDAGGQALLHPIVTVRHGKKENPWEIDAISGATISSRAIGRALDESASALLPQLMRQLPQFTLPEETTP
ncbi:MAG: FMN-binding protein [Gammaproteobacteria bacterium]|nr:FMN-binding protein [Gammaproteobacteria bacterium]